MAVNVGDHVTDTNGAQGVVKAISGTDCTCLVLMYTGKYTNWIPQESVKLIPVAVEQSNKE